MATSLNNVIAYRPRFSDYHNSNLAGVFINLEGVCPWFEQVTNYNPICRVFTNEEDGFRNGKALINTADSGNDFRIFSFSAIFLPMSLQFKVAQSSIQHASQISMPSLLFATFQGLHVLHNELITISLL